MRADVFDTATSFLDSTYGILILLGGVVGVLFIIIVAWKARGALTAILSGAIAGMLFVWVVNNVANDEVQSQITDTIITDGHGPDLPGQDVPAAVAAGSGSSQGV